MSYCPPETYQQWLDAFALLQDHPGDRELLNVLARGSYLGQPSQAFLVRLSQTMGQVLTCHCRRFLKQLDQILQEGEPDMGVYLAVRFRKHLKLCFFYRNLDFLPEDYIGQLDKGFTDQLQSFWADFLRQLKKSARLGDSPGLEEMMLEMKRIKIM